LLFVPSNHLATVGPDALGLDFTAYRINGLLIEKFGSVFHGTYAGTNGQTIRIEYSTNLTEWPSLQTNNVGPNGLLDFYDTNQPTTRIKAFRSLIIE
jgi:hypothetical protein